MDMLDEGVHHLLLPNVADKLNTCPGARTASELHACLADARANSQTPYQSHLVTLCLGFVLGLICGVLVTRKWDAHSPVPPSQHPLQHTTQHASKGSEADAHSTPPPHSCEQEGAAAAAAASKAASQTQMEQTKASSTDPHPDPSLTTATFSPSSPTPLEAGAHVSSVSPAHSFTAQADDCVSTQEKDWTPQGERTDAEQQQQQQEPQEVEQPLELQLVPRPRPSVSALHTDAHMVGVASATAPVTVQELSLLLHQQQLQMHEQRQKEIKLQHQLAEASNRQLVKEAGRMLSWWVGELCGHSNAHMSSKVGVHVGTHVSSLFHSQPHSVYLTHLHACRVMQKQWDVICYTTLKPVMMSLHGIQSGFERAPCTLS